MKEMLQRLKAFCFADVRPDVQEEIDKANVKSMFLLSVAASILNTFVLCFYFLISKEYDFFKVLCVLFCIVVSVVGIVISQYMRSKEIYNHRAVTAFAFLYFFLMIDWAEMISYRHYAQNEQMLVFYLVILCFVCFVTYKPIASLILMSAAYGGMYAIMFLVNGASEINVYNYIVFALMSLIGMISRYYGQTDASKKNLAIMYNSRHDELTGLRNRAALSEDIKTFLNHKLTIIMSDIDYFKKINDEYGHIAGDNAIAEAAKYIREYFPGALVYRYGGDEFLIVIKNADVNDVIKICENYRNKEILINNELFGVKLSFGISGGKPENESRFKELVLEADKKMYEMKKQAHKEN